MKIIKLLITVYFLLGIVFLTEAKVRSNSEAAGLAKVFVHKNTGSAFRAPYNINAIVSIQPFGINVSNNVNRNSDNYFHIFNIGSDNGFVIVSADDRTKTILGYADEGSFDINNIPDNLRELLTVYANEINGISTTATQTQVQAVDNSSFTENLNFAASVSPLLKNIKWNQGSPYNLLCPIIDSTAGTRAVVGCGATALAQVMKYYNWPVTGTGSNAYTTTTLKIPLSVNFASTTYDWANMTGIYNTSSTDIQKNAVATLMYHCAVAVNMDFNKSSNSYTTDIAKSLSKYFGYDSNIQVYIRNYYTKSEWENLIKTELNNARPVLYNGQATDGGHIFVCDGYDTNGLYHINWGWGGISDGYFELSALNPNELGIGGGNAGGYNSDQYMIIGIQKPTATSTPSYLIYTNQLLSASVSQVGRTGSFNITAQKTFNYGINTISGSFGVGLYNGNTLVQVLNSTTINLNSFYGWNTYSFSNITVPTGIAAGNYKIYMIYKTASASEWTRVRGKVGTPNYLNTTIDASLIKFSVPSDNSPVLTLNSIENTGNLYQNKTGRFKVKITNTGAEYNAEIRIYADSLGNSLVNQSIATDPVNIASGETKEIEFNGKITLKPGTYNLSLMYDASNNIDATTTFTALGNTTQVQVLAEPTGTPLLSLNQTIAFSNPQNIFMSNASLNATITNTGAYFENKLIAFIFATTAGSSLTYIGYQTGILDQNETKTFDFTGSIALSAGDYRIGAYYMDAATAKWTRLNPTGSSLIYFTLKEDLTAIDSDNFLSFVIYPNPATDFIQLKSDNTIIGISIYDIYGKQIKNYQGIMLNEIKLNISELKTGAYLIKVQNDNETNVYKFIKN